MEILKEKMANLNAQQKKAVKDHFGNSLILAGAGTGKTTVITCRIADMIFSGGIDPQHILAVTFTNRAAKEMKERVVEIVGSNVTKSITINTFHSFCLKVLRQYIHHLGYSKNFSIIDVADQQGIIKEYLGQFSKVKDLETKDFYTIINKISSFKQQYLFPDDVEELTAEDIFFKDVYYFYQGALFDMNLVDFDDLLVLTIKLWKNQPIILQKCQENYRYIMVDEFQDTNSTQLQLLQLLTCGEHSNICVVGDDDQAIYHWRGAEVKNILNFPQLFPNTKIIKLEQNYRSTNLILNTANAIIKGNVERHDKKLWSTKGDGEKIGLIKAETPEREAEYVARLISHIQEDNKIAFEDFAILYRSNKQSRVLEEKLRFRGVPYHIVGDRSFYSRREIKDAIAYLRILNNPTDDMSLLRVINTPSRGIGANSMLKIRQYVEEKKIPILQAMRDVFFLLTLTAKTQESITFFINICDKYTKALQKGKFFAQTVKDYLQEIGYIDGLEKIYREAKEVDNRRSNVMELLDNIRLPEEADGANPLKRYLDTVSLSENYAKTKEKDNFGVTLLTVHASKGLEFSYVFVLGLEQDLFPHRNSIENGEVNEERRLFYVAITRAKNKLFFLWVADRKSYGNNTRRIRSQFIEEVPSEYLEVVKYEILNPVLSADSMMTQMQSFIDEK